MGYRPGGECYLFSEPILGANMDGMPCYSGAGWGGREISLVFQWLNKGCPYIGAAVIPGADAGVLSQIYT